ncbi:MAG: hypothetical protein ACOCWU_05495, partial [Spirochaetota bacterium]
MGEEFIAERKRSVYAQVDALAPQLRDIAERIHAQPETSFGEYFASGLLADAVEKAGFFVERGAGGLERPHGRSRRVDTYRVVRYTYIHGCM